MRGLISYKALIAGMTVIAVSAGTVLAQSQQVPSGVRMTLDVIQRFSAGDNLSRVAAPRDNSVLSQTDFVFGVTSETRNQSLALDLGATARVGDLPDEGGSVSEVTNPFVTFGYEQRSARSTLSFEGTYREVDLRDQVITFDDGVDLIDFTINNGKRKQTNADLRFVFGEGGPVVTDLRLRLDKRRFDSADASLTDQDSLRFDGSVRMAATRNTDVIVGLRTIRTETFDATNRVVDEVQASVGTVTQITPATRLDLALGSSTIDVDEGGTKTSDNEIIARAAVSHTVANGDIGIQFDRRHSTAGLRDSLQVTRNLELQQGSLALAVGGSKASGTDLQPTASISYQQNFKQAALITDVTQTVSGNSDAEEFRTIGAGVRYVHTLTPLAQLDLSYRVTDVEQITGGTEERERTVASVAVNYNLTEDWALTAGFRHEEQTENSVQTLKSDEVFATFSRSFDLQF